MSNQPPENLKVTDRSAEGEQRPRAAATKTSAENFTAEQQAQPTEKFSTWSGEEPKKVLLAAKPGESLEEFTARTNQYHEEMERKAKEKPPVQPLCIGGFEDGSVITAAGRQQLADKLLEPPAIRHEAAHKAVSVDPRPSYVEGLKAIGKNEEAQGLYSIEYMERKGREALAATQNTSRDPDRVLVADNDPEHDQVLLAQLNTKAEAADKPKLQGYVSEPENPWQAFKNLIPEQRSEVIRILNNASQDTIDAMNQQDSDVLHGKPVIDFVLSIDRAVRALGTGSWKENIAHWALDLHKIATGQPVGQQEPIEKTATLGAGTLVKGIQGVDQVGQHLHPRAFVHDTHATAEVMRAGIGTASDYYGKKLQNNDLGSIPGETLDAANYAKERALTAINEFPNKDVTEQSNVLGTAAATIVFLIATTRELITPEQARKMGLLNLTEEELEAKGIQKKHIKDVPPEDIVNPIERTATAEQKIAQLMALSEQNKPVVEKFLKAIDTKFGTKSEMSFKEPRDILDKAKRPSIKEVKDWFDVEHVRDSFRFRTQVENLSDLPNLVEALKSSGFEIINPDFDKLLNPKNRGWRMVALDLRAPNGQIVEYQILPREMQEAGKLEHEIYKAWRGKDMEKLSFTEKAMKLEADQEAAKLYKTAWLNYLKRTGQTESSVQQIIDETRKAMNKW